MNNMNAETELKFNRMLIRCKFDNIADLLYYTQTCIKQARLSWSETNRPLVLFYLANCIGYAKAKQWPIEKEWIQEQLALAKMDFDVEMYD